MKENVGPDAVGRLAAAFAAADPGFPATEFERDCLRGIEELELTARFARVAAALDENLPEEFERAASVVGDAASDPYLGLWDLWSVTVWIGDAGAAAADVDRAAELLARITQRCSGEFGVRPLIDRDSRRMRSIMLAWAGSGDEHLRRLASEGSRPMLPWAPRLEVSRTDPGWGLPLLEPLIADPSEYVRRSVANHLNDISKLDRDLALETAAAWLERGKEPTPKLVAHALRSLVRSGDPTALALVGADPDAAIEVERLTVAPRSVREGDAVSISILLRSHDREPRRAVCDYALEFARPGGRSSRKVFKLGSLRLEPGEGANFERRYAFRPLRTRAYHPGTHAVEVLVNGRPAARAEFTLAD